MAVKRGIKVLEKKKKARHDYFIEDTLECGIALQGTEVKSIRNGQLNLKDSYAQVKNGELLLVGMHVSPYAQGNIYNINADTAAAYIAGAISAECLITMTDIAGILRDRNDPASLIPCIDIAEARELAGSGIIDGGMIPKVECCIEAIRRGVRQVIIMDGRIPHAILIETLTDEGAGTMVVAERAPLPADTGKGDSL